MQVLAGDVLAAQESYWHYFTLWRAFDALPERFMYTHGQLHSNQQQYSLRPELMESTFYLYQVKHSVTNTATTPTNVPVMVNNDNASFADNHVITIAVVQFLILMIMTMETYKVMIAVSSSSIS